MIKFLFEIALVLFALLCIVAIIANYRLYNLLRHKADKDKVFQQFSGLKILMEILILGCVIVALFCPFPETGFIPGLIMKWIMLSVSVGLLAGILWEGLLIREIVKKYDQPE